MAWLSHQPWASLRVLWPRVPQLQWDCFTLTLPPPDRHVSRGLGLCWGWGAAKSGRQEAWGVRRPVYRGGKRPQKGPSSRETGRGGGLCLGPKGALE